MFRESNRIIVTGSTFENGQVEKTLLLDFKMISLCNNHNSTWLDIGQIIQCENPLLDFLVTFIELNTKRTHT